MSGINRVRHLCGTWTLGNVINALAGLAHLRNYEKYLKAAENAGITTNTHTFDHIINNYSRKWREVNNCFSIYHTS